MMGWVVRAGETNATDVERHERLGVPACHLVPVLSCAWRVFAFPQLQPNRETGDPGNG
jgi:hypothetical protein